MSIDEYLSKVPESRLVKVRALIDLIIKAYPECEASLKYKMPTFESQQGWVAVANQKSYVSLYTCDEKHIAEFKLAHPRIKTGKGCINFLDKDDLPVDALLQVIDSAMSANNH